MKLTETEMQERREKIILVAFHLFCKRGIEQVPLVEIAKEAGVGETTIYRYFENKSNLVLEAFVKLWDSIMRTVEFNAKNTMNYYELTGYQQVSVWLDSFQRLYLENRDFILFSYEAKLYLMRHNMKLNALHQDLLMHAIKKPCLEALDKGKKDGTIPTKEDSEDLFYVIWGAIRGYIVKVAIYRELYIGESPWESRYDVLKTGILCALSAKWEAPEDFDG